MKKKWGKKLKLFFNKNKKGQIQSIVDTYKKIKTPYIFHCEDDWIYTRSGFIEDSLKILKTDKVDYVIASDTDSVYITFDVLVDKVFKSGRTDEEVVNFLDRLAKEKLEPFIGESYQALAKSMNAYDQ